MKNFAVTLGLVLTLCSSLSAWAGALPIDSGLEALVLGQKDRIQAELPETLMGLEIDFSTLRCVAIGTSMLGSCVARATRVQGAYATPAFVQIGVKQPEDDEGVRFDVQLLLAQAW
jgi:hypothetical protein